MSSTIRFKAPGLVSSTRLGMMEEIIDGQEKEEGGKIESIPRKKAEDLIEIIRSGMQRSRNPPSSISSKRQESSGHTRSETIQNEDETTTQTHLGGHSVISIADELSRLAKLRDQGIITETEFVQMKGDLIKRT